MDTGDKIVLSTLATAAVVGAGYGIYQKLKPRGIRIDRVVLNPDYIDITVGQTANFCATALYSDGSTKDVTGLTTWIVHDSDILTLTDLGVVQGVAPGISRVEANYLGVVGSSQIRVT